MLMLNDTVTVLKPAPLHRRAARRLLDRAGGTGVLPERPPQDSGLVPSAEPGRKPLREVALLIETSGSYGRGLLRGIAKYNREHGGWSTCFRPHGLEEPVPAWLSRWRGDGMLVRLQAPEMLASIRRLGIPIVNLRPPSLGMPHVGIDDAQVAELALAHLRERGIHHFAFCGRPGSTHPALVERCNRFRELVETAGDTCHVFSLASAPRARSAGRLDPWHLEQQRLVEWVRGLPTPVGIMACNDERGLHVLDACRRCGLKVPEEVAVIGVDNDQAICELTIPPLSSVDVNAEAIGYEAAALLDRMMDGQAVPEDAVAVAPRGVITRRSTDTIASDDVEVARALRYIRENACRGLQVMDVLSHMAMSRASLQQRMKQVVGRTIHQEIQQVRLHRVKNLLATSDMTIKQVAREGGFASVQYMTRVFRAVTGETPARYRSCRAR